MHSSEKITTFALSIGKRDKNIVQQIKRYTIMKVDFFVKLQNSIKRANSSTLDELRVSIDYCKGGHNYATGSYEERGIKVFFTPIHRDRLSHSTSILGSIIECGFKMHVLDTNRKSQKKIDKVADAIKPHLDKFGELWGQEDFARTIYNMVMEAVANMPK